MSRFRLLICCLVPVAVVLAATMTGNSRTSEAGKSSLAYFEGETLVQPRTDAHGDPLLPDFSYAGYRFGQEAIPDVEGPVFDVTEFGAVADDQKDDTAAIQEAIDAAGKAGGGVVFFPPGVFHLNTEIGETSALVIENSNVVLRGSGSTEDGTILHKVNEMPRGYVIQIRSPQPGIGDFITGIEGSVARNMRSLMVEDPTQLSEGQWVVLRVRNPDKVVPYFMGSRTAHEDWSYIHDNGVELKEIHQIESIDGRQVTLKAPVMITFRESYEPALAAFSPIEETGVEDLTVMGNWIGHFIHHRSDLDDYYFNAIDHNSVVNSWVRRVSFVNLNQVLRSRSSANLSLKHIRLAGTGGHTASMQISSTRNLIGLFADDSDGYWHNPGWRNHTAGAVFWRMDLHPTMPIDVHGRQPYSSLLDAISGGYLMDGGGSSATFPQHGPGLVIWNFDYMPGAIPDQIEARDFPIDFWRHRPWVVDPIIVGLHGAAEDIGVVEESILLLESLGTPVEPESLYEAQLKDRFGALPEWLTDARAFWEDYRNAPYPEHFHPMEQGNTVFHHYSQEIPLEYLASAFRELSQVRRQPSDFDVILDEAGVFRSDYMKIKMVVNNALSYVHSFSVPFGEWHLYADPVGDRGTLEIRVEEESGGRVLAMDVAFPIEEPEGYYDQFPRANSVYQKYLGDNKAQEWDGAVEMVRALGGRIEKYNVDGGSRVRIEIPEME